MKSLIFDTETTGLIENRSVKLTAQPHVIDFYAALVDLRTGEIEKEWDYLIKPPKPITAEITGITGITNEMVDGKPDFAHYAPFIKQAIQEAPLVIAHNLSFDKEMIDLEFERLGQVLTWPSLSCTVEATIHLKGFRLTLSALHELLFGQSFSGAHRAKHDVAALIRCAVELAKRGEI